MKDRPNDKGKERLPQAPWSSYPTDVIDMQRPEPHAKPHELAREPHPLPSPHPHPAHPASPAKDPKEPHYHAILFPVADREVEYPPAPPSRTLTATRLAAVFLGLFYVLFSLAENLVRLGSGIVTANGRIVLEYAQPHNAIHWLVAIVLVAACLARDAATRILVLAVGVLFTLVSVASVLARGPAGEALGHGGPLPWTYVGASIATAVVALLAAFASRTAITPPQPGVGRTA